jgi:hypothetical protein
MHASTALRDASQRPWLDTISRHPLESSAVHRSINDDGDHRS